MGPSAAGFRADPELQEPCRRPGSGPGALTLNQGESFDDPNNCRKLADKGN